MNRHDPVFALFLAARAAWADPQAVLIEEEQAPGAQGLRKWWIRRPGHPDLECGRVIREFPDDFACRRQSGTHG